MYKWKERQWTMNLVTVNAIVTLFSLIVYILIAFNPALINGDIISYLASLFGLSLTSVTNFISLLVWIIVVVGIITMVKEVYDSYRKAKKR